VPSLDFGIRLWAALYRPTLANYAATPEKLQERAGDIFRWVQEGKLKINEPTTYPLAQAADAQRALESRSLRPLLVPYVTCTL
jgi:NADPH2:quinone reductase